MASCVGNESYKSMVDQEGTLLEAITVFYSATNIFLSITTSLGNILILIARHKVSFFLPFNKVVISLPCSHWSFWWPYFGTALCHCVRLISEPLFATVILRSVVNMDKNTLRYATAVNIATSFIFREVSTITSTAISVERFLALLLWLRYRSVVTLRRVRAFVIFWLTGVSAGFLFLL